jgi:hypothetical protein
MLEYLQSIWDEPWKPMSRAEVVAWLVFYVGFLAYAFSAHGGFLFIDSANLVVHEGGHNLFGWFGPTLGLYGGTLLQWLVPFLLAAYFFSLRQTAGFVFCLFFFFENWLYTATYMADARAQELPLVTTGDPDFVEHDFHAIFSGLSVLNYDTKIAALVRALGWCGMLACVAWLVMRSRTTSLNSGTFRDLVSNTPKRGHFHDSGIPLVRSRNDGGTIFRPAVAERVSDADLEDRTPRAH